MPLVTSHVRFAFHAIISHSMEGSVVNLPAVIALKKKYKVCVCLCVWVHVCVYVCLWMYVCTCMHGCVFVCIIPLVTLFRLTCILMRHIALVQWAPLGEEW